jgi:hypothetical protein
MLFDEDVSAHNFQTIEQKLDHFNSSSNITFLQRYVINTDLYNNSHVLIVYICGESPLTRSRVEKNFPFYLASVFGAVLAALEHRYYGESQPFKDDLSLEHLKYLSSHQALDDVAYFINFLKSFICDFIVYYVLNLAEYHDLDLRKVIIIGCSYSGALSAWFRSFYPHLADAAIASSAPSIIYYLFIFIYSILFFLCVSLCKGGFF